jgi:hypothetical protein
MSQTELTFIDTTYEEIYQDLMAKDKKLYTENGMLHLVDRNRRIKEKPEKFSESRERFDLIITVEEKVYDNVLAIFEETHNVHHQPAHVINVDVVSLLLIHETILNLLLIGLSFRSTIRKMQQSALFFSANSSNCLVRAPIWTTK